MPPGNSVSVWPSVFLPPSNIERYLLCIAKKAILFKWIVLLLKAYPFRAYILFKSFMYMSVNLSQIDYILFCFQQEDTKHYFHFFFY